MTIVKNVMEKTFYFIVDFEGSYEVMSVFFFRVYHNVKFNSFNNGSD